jgi:addiction module RelE/StbE family toxin
VQTVRWSDEATTGLVEIIDFIEQRNAAAARQLHAAIVKSAENLPMMPYLFPLGRVASTREHVVHPNYIVVYQVGINVIDILRVLHSRQQYP